MAVLGDRCFLCPWSDWDDSMMTLLQVSSDWMTACRACDSFIVLYCFRAPHDARSSISNFGSEFRRSAWSVSIWSSWAMTWVGLQNRAWCDCHVSSVWSSMFIALALSRVHKCLYRRFSAERCVMILAEQEETWPFDLQISIWTLQTQQRTPTDKWRKRGSRSNCGLAAWELGEWDLRTVFSLLDFSSYISIARKLHFEAWEWPLQTVQLLKIQSYLAILDESWHFPLFIDLS